jgi:hypothetical protein
MRALVLGRGRLGVLLRRAVGRALRHHDHRVLLDPAELLDQFLARARQRSAAGGMGGARTLASACAPSLCIATSPRPSAMPCARSCSM